MKSVPFSVFSLQEVEVELPLVACDLQGVQLESCAPPKIPIKHHTEDISVVSLTLPQVKQRTGMIMVVQTTKSDDHHCLLQGRTTNSVKSP